MLRGTTVRPGTVNRGDAAAQDFVKTDFIRDGAIHDLDLSSIIPKNVKVVYVVVKIVATTANQIFAVRTKGHSNWHNQSQARTTVANVGSFYDLQLFPDKDGFCEYYATTGITGALNLTVKGWGF